ncbi:MAG: 5-bromo-4-chloroindolyl phosphate hydrolysis family protein [Oscillospiraceae bacterium]|nr:5-bromo-4-chloroindolyl phosphate hydrolysis family protein [Oscillospiraceae bacterium]
MDFLKNFDGKKIPWWLVIGAFVVASPVGLALLLLKLLAGEKQSTAVNEPSLQQWAPMQLPTEKVDTRINKPKYANAAPVDSSRHITIPANPKKAKTGGTKVLGAILFLIGALSFTGELSDIITSLAFLLGGVALGVNAFLTDKKQKRFAAYLPVIGNREAMDMDELSRISGVPRSQVEKDLQKMLELNYFGGGAYLNRELGYLFKSSEADEAWREQHPDAREEPPAEVSEGYSGILRDIRRANDRIADPVLSAKIDQLENIVGRILRVMEEDPEKAKRMDTFMTYYLPTTQKLLDSYARFEAAGVEGENLRESKQKIASTMDMILKGFSRQLDELYKADAMDINSDIRVMETMLKRDAGSVSDDFGFGGSAVQKAPWESQ